MPSPRDEILVESLVSSRTRKGMVQISWGDNRAQLTAEQARRHALLILEAAEAARSDELVFSLLTQKLGLPDAQAVAVIGSMREMRERADAEEKPA